MLCLLVVALLWVIFIINLFFGYLPFPELFINSIDSILYALITLSCYFVSILGINVLAPGLHSDRQIQSLKQSINSLKADEDVFVALLKKQPFYETSDEDSIIHRILPPIFLLSI